MHGREGKREEETGGWGGGGTNTDRWCCIIRFVFIKWVFFLQHIVILGIKIENILKCLRRVIDAHKVSPVLIWCYIKKINKKKKSITNFCLNTLIVPASTQTSRLHLGVQALTSQKAILYDSDDMLMWISQVWIIITPRFLTCGEGENGALRNHWKDKLEGSFEQDTLKIIPVLGFLECCKAPEQVIRQV